MPGLLEQPWLVDTLNDDVEESSSSSDEEGDYDEVNDDGDRIPRRCRGLEAAELTRDELLEGVSDRVFYDLFRMPKGTFITLADWLENNTSASGSQRLSLEFKLLVFLWICAFTAPQRAAANKFRISQSCVSGIVQQLLGPMVQLHSEFVKLPCEEYLSTDIELAPKFSPFSGTIGVIDGTHVGARIPRRLSRRWRDRRGNVSQNVFAAVSSGGYFTFVMPGAEGSFSDSILLPRAVVAGFKIQEKRLYLGDAGFGTRRGILLPYNRTRYHLQDWIDAARKPCNKEELFNLRHAQLRVIVENVFGRCKQKWKMMRSSPPEYSIKDQVDFVLAMTGLFNFIKSGGQTPAERDEEEEEVLLPTEIEILQASKEHLDDRFEGLTMAQVRDKIANELWEGYEEYLQRQDEEERQ